MGDLGYLLLDLNVWSPTPIASSRSARVAQLACLEGGVHLDRRVELTAPLRWYVHSSMVAATPDSELGFAIAFPDGVAQTDLRHAVYSAHSGREPG